MLDRPSLAAAETAIRFETIQSLSHRESLEPILGPISAIDSESLGTVGFSGSSHRRLRVELRSGGRRSLILKHVYLDRDWSARRTGDTLGREAALLGEPRLRGIWEAFRRPYLAYAMQDGEIGLLMGDLSPNLLPDVDTPITPDEENRLLAALAAMHARYWDTRVPHLPWLASPAQLLRILGPQAGAEEMSGENPHPMFDLVVRGWTLALDSLPASLVELVKRPPELLARECEGLPNTIIHGDAKVANFALFADETVAAFDWALIGAAPCTFDLGWYLAVNSGRLARPKEEVVERYHTLLLEGLGEALRDELWERLMRVGILHGALMLLWMKALAAESGEQREIAEWDWWADQLERVVSSR